MQLKCLCSFPIIISTGSDRPCASVLHTHASIRPRNGMLGHRVCGLHCDSDKLPAEEARPVYPLTDSKHISKNIKYFHQSELETFSSYSFNFKEAEPPSLRLSARPRCWVRSVRAPVAARGPWWTFGLCSV